MSYIRNLYSRLRLAWNLSIRRQLALSFSIASLLVVLGSGFLLFQYERNEQYALATRRAVELAHALSFSSTSWVLASDLAGLQEVVKGVSDSTDLKWAVILSTENEVLASTRDQDVGKYFSDAVSRRLQIDGIAEHHILLDEDNLIDVAVPVMAGNRLIGWVRIESTRNETRAYLHELALAGLGISLLLVLTLIGIAIWLSRSITSGLNRLAITASDAAAGRALLRVDEARPDEIGVLARHLYRMLDTIDEKQQALIESEQRFRLLSEHSPLAIYVSSGIEQNAEYINSTFTRMFGYTLEEVSSVAQWWPKAYPDEAYRKQVSEEWTCKVEQAIATRSEIVPVETIVTCKDGSLKNVQWGYISMGMQNWAFGLDMTERKQMEAELIRYKEHLEEEVQERTADLLLARDKAEAAEQSLRESDSAVRRKLASLIEPEGDLGELSLSDILDVPELQSLMDEFYRLTHMGCAIIDMNGKVLVSTGWQDICTRFHRIHHESCKHCIESDTMLSKGAEVGTYKRYHCKNNMWDMSTPIVVGGQHLGNMFFGQFFFEDEVPDIELFRQQAVRYGFDEHEYLAALARAPRWNREAIDALMMFYAKLSAAISRLSYSTVKLARTLTERDLVAQALTKARDEAESANRAKSVFLASMSHELRTPLNAILGFSSLMRRDEQLRPEQRTNLDIINRSGEHLLTLINDILEVSKIEAGKTQLNITPFDLGNMVREVTDMMELRAREKGLQLLLDQSSEFPRYIMGDEARLRQILINLLGNAVKFTRDGGVTLRLGTKQNTTTHLIIEIEDSGPGISAEDQLHLFQPFMQFGKQAGDNKGTGLGLSITRQFVQLMGGSINVESNAGKGSLFRVDLPLNEVKEANLPTPQETARGEVIGLEFGQPAYRILIVEDQLENQLLLTQLMQRIGFEVKLAEDGRQGVQLFKSWQPDLIFMDRRMPVMDGIEATRAIRQLPGGKRVKIVAVTASAFTEQRDETLAAGMDGFVRKPYRFNEIYDSLARHLGVHYRYARVQEETAVALTAEMLTVLPQALRNELKTALESLESRHINKVLDKIASCDAVLYDALLLLVENYDYPAILKQLQVAAE